MATGCHSRIWSGPARGFGPGRPVENKLPNMPIFVTFLVVFLVFWKSGICVLVAASYSMACAIAPHLACPEPAADRSYEFKSDDSDTDSLDGKQKILMYFTWSHDRV